MNLLTLSVVAAASRFDYIEPIRAPSVIPDPSRFGHTLTQSKATIITSDGQIKGHDDKDLIFPNCHFTLDGPNNNKSTYFNSETGCFVIFGTGSLIEKALKEDGSLEIYVDGNLQHTFEKAGEDPIMEKLLNWF